MVGAVPFDWQAHDSYFVVAHLHYVLIGGVVFPIFAALYYWLPKYTGRLFDERLGRWNFWLMFIGFHVAFFPQHIVGLLGMPRRYYTYPPEFGWDIYNLISTIGAFILASGVFIFVVNFFYSKKQGEIAGANPWGADSLEWALSSPPLNYGFSALPIVRSRHPLWDQDNLAEGGERIQKIVHGFARWPLKWRGAMITSTVEGKPEEIFRVSGPSLWPFVTAVGLVIIFAAEIFALRAVSLLGIATLIIGIVGWNWPESVPTTDEEEQAFAEEYDIPVRSYGSQVVSRSAMQLLILLLGIALTSFLFSYFYIRIENDVWPLGNIALPNLLWPAIGTILLLINGGLLRWAARQLQHEKLGPVRLGLGLGFALELGTLGTLLYDFSRLGYDWQVNAYASLMYIIGGFLMLVLITGIGVNLFTQYWSWRGIYSAERKVAVENTALYWTAVIFFWLVTVGVLYVSPHFV
jgi:cytochrome c oxidase subunit I+III